MLIAARQMRKCLLEGPGGHLGKVKDLLFDRETWTVRYLEVDMGVWLPDRRVILSPNVVQRADYASRRLDTRLTRDQVEKSPPVESDLPVSRRKEIELAQHFAWGAYWANIELARRDIQREGDPNLHSTRGVSGYRIGAKDGDIGHVDDFIVDDRALNGSPWEIRYLVVDTRNWLPGRQVLIPPLWAQTIDWESRHVYVDIPRETIANSPGYDPATPINRQYEEMFFDYYGHPVYWREVEHTH